MNMSTCEIFGGIEGGSSGSRIVLVQRNGKLLGRAEGPHTNHWESSMTIIVDRIVELVRRALKSAELPPDTKLKSLGLSLSGIDTEACRKRLIETIQYEHPDLSEHLYAGNDSLGTFLTATDNGTGSICKFIKSDLSYIRFGGFGYMLSDEGSGFWISHQAILAYIKCTEGVIFPEHSIKGVASVIKQHFNINHHYELLPYFNTKLNKCFIAQICKQLAEIADEGDQFARDLFAEAGHHLGQYALAAVRTASKQDLFKAELLEVVCCGSVFKSWHLIKAGFLTGLTPERPDFNCAFRTLRLIRLKRTAAFGAARLAARVSLSIDLPKPTDAVEELGEIDLSDLKITSNGRLTRQPALSNVCG